MSENNMGYFGRSNEILNDFLSKLAKPGEPDIDKDKVLRDFEAFEKEVLGSPRLIQVFAALKERFAEDPEYKAKVDPNFVAGVMLLNLPSERE